MLKFTRYVPALNRVLVKRVDPITKTKSGIILTDNSKMELNYGTVISTGPGLTYTNGVKRPMDIKTGQTVLLPGYAGAKITMGDGEDYWVYRDDDIIGILEEPTK